MEGVPWSTTNPGVPSQGPPHETVLQSTHYLKATSKTVCTAAAHRCLRRMSAQCYLFKHGPYREGQSHDVVTWQQGHPQAWSQHGHGCINAALVRRYHMARRDSNDHQRCLHAGLHTQIRSCTQSNLTTSTSPHTALSQSLQVLPGPHERGADQVPSGGATQHCMRAPSIPWRRGVCTVPSLMWVRPLGWWCCCCCSRRRCSSCCWRPSMRVGVTSSVRVWVPPTMRPSRGVVWVLHAPWWGCVGVHLGVEQRCRRLGLLRGRGRGVVHGLRLGRWRRGGS